MALKIYTAADPDSDLSTNGTYSNPLSLTFDGVNGGVIEKRLYVRNDNVNFTYSSITLTPNDTGIFPITDGSNGYSWKVLSGDQRPLEEQWSAKTAAESISLSNINDTTTYLSFWLRVEVPAAAAVESFQTVALRISSTETPV